MHDRFCSYVINDEGNEDWLSCTPLITFRLLLCAAEMTVRVQMLYSKGIPAQKGEIQFWMGGQAIFSYSIHHIFLKEQ